MERRGHAGQISVSVGKSDERGSVVDIPAEWTNKRLVVVPEDQLVLLAHNRHVHACGTPPGLTIATGDKVAYFENEFGEQWVLVHRKQSNETKLFGGDVGWENAVRLVQYRGQITTPDKILNVGEQEWLNLVVKQSGIQLKRWRPKTHERAIWEALRAMRYYSPNPQAAGAPVIRVFISSPSDLKVERRALAKLTIELGREMHLPVHPMLWEGADIPGSYVPPFPPELIGTSAQAVIDKHIFERLGGYDVYIGLIWSRMGTPTGKYRSGTEAELRSAQAMKASEGRPSTILFYNKQTPIPPNRIDVGQFRRAKRFLGELRTEGIVHDFATTPALRAMVRAHLAEALLKITKTDAVWRRLLRELRQG